MILWLLAVGGGDTRYTNAGSDLGAMAVDSTPDEDVDAMQAICTTNEMAPKTSSARMSTRSRESPWSPHGTRSTPTSSVRSISLVLVRVPVVLLHNIDVVVLVAVLHDHMQISAT